MDDLDLANIIHAVVTRLPGLISVNPDACESDLIDAALHIIRESNLNPGTSLECGACGSSCIVGAHPDESEEE